MLCQVNYSNEETKRKLKEMQVPVRWVYNCTEEEERNKLLTILN